MEERARLYLVAWSACPRKGKGRVKVGHFPCVGDEAQARRAGWEEVAPYPEAAWNRDVDVLLIEDKLVRIAALEMGMKDA